MLLYKQTYYPKTSFNDLEWFALEPNYGNSYGTIVNIYHINKSVKLLDIGKNKHRNLLIKLSLKKYPDIDAEYILDPNEQYSGSTSNKTAHVLIKKLIGDYYDGTTIQETNCDPENEGSTEVVLWNFDKLIKYKY